MPFNILLLNHLLCNQTSYGEEGTKISIDRKNDENIFFFHLDNDKQDTLKSYLGLREEREFICDLLIYYHKKEKEPTKRVLCLAENKGKDVKHGIEQIENIYNALHPKINKSCKNYFNSYAWAGFVQMKKGTRAPKNIKTMADDIKKKGLAFDIGRKEGDFRRFIRSF
jgi:hypothetical protein